MEIAEVISILRIKVWQKVAPSFYLFVLLPIWVTLQSNLSTVINNAEKGDAQAQYLLGSTYEAGRLVPKDQMEAVKWYRKAAEQNHPEAQFKLGSDSVK